MTLKDVESIRIDGIDYAIKHIDIEIAGDMGFVGKVDYSNHNIKLVDYSPQYKVQTLMHELIHVIDENRLDRKLTEGEVNAIGCGLGQILLDNPDLVLAIYYASIGDQIVFEENADFDDDTEDDCEED